MSVLRLRLVWPLLIAVAAACSSDPAPATVEVPGENNDTPDAAASTLTPDATSKPMDTPDTGPVVDNDAGMTTGDSSTTTTDGGGGEVDAGPPTTLDAGADADPIKCVGSGTAEIEPNDSAATATTLTGTVCGYIATPGTESDFLTFTLKTATTSFGVNYNGNITLTFTVDGKTIVWGNGSFPPVPFVKGKPYVIEVKSSNAAKADYRVTLTET